MTWYIARVRPGWGRIAPKRLVEPEERKGETFVERSLADAGFGHYFPKMRKEIVHHRTKKKMVKRFPLFTGYIFVRGLSQGGVSAVDCDGVSYLLGSSEDGEPSRPVPVADGIVLGFMDAEAELEFDDTSQARRKRQQEGRTWRETVAMQFPQGRRVMIKGTAFDHPFAGFHGEVTGVTGRGMVRTMMNLLGGTVPVEVEPQDLEAA